MKGGYLVKYIDKYGNTQKGRVMHTDQRPEFEKQGKALVRLLDSRFQNTGQNVIKKESDLGVIGFID